MPFGTFLDSLPSILFVGAHVAFLIAGVWVARSASRTRASFAPFVWLYVVSQAVFLGYFGGAITMKMAVLTEQTMMIVLVAALALAKTRSRA